jgi:xanthine dehydrogenase YagR molybdenum-binding subunit
VTIETSRRFITTTIVVEGREETKVVEMPDRELRPWDADERLDIVGKSMPRVDAPEKVTGAAVYTADRTAAGQLYAVLVRSAIPRGRAVRIDLDGARRIHGFVDAIVFDDLPQGGKPIRAGGVRFLDPMVSYVGQPLACVTAETMRQARAAARAVRIEYEVAPFAVTAQQAVAPDAPEVRVKGDNVSRSSPDVCSRGDTARGLSEADVVVRGKYTTASALHSAMEAHGALAEWQGDRLTI